MSSTREKRRSSAEVPRSLALGDSYTIGECVPEHERWPMQLAGMIRKAGVPLAAPTIIAQTGWTTDDLLTALRASKPAGIFQLVSLQIGVNNQYRGLGEEQFARELDELLELAATYSGRQPSRVLVLSIPDWGVTPFAQARDRREIANEIERFNRLKRRQANRRGFSFVDVTPASREAASDPGLLAEDGLHPSGRMYKRWCELALPAARVAFSLDSEG